MDVFPLQRKAATDVFTAKVSSHASAVKHMARSFVPSWRRALPKPSLIFRFLLEAAMKRRWIKLLIAFILLIGAVTGLCICEQSKRSVAYEILNSTLVNLDPQKITALAIWYNSYTVIYRYEETDAEKIGAIYESLRHMKVIEGEKDRNRPGLWCMISCVQDGEKIELFSYWRGSATGDYIVPFGMDSLRVTNLWQLERDYGWLTSLDEMIAKCDILE